MTAIVRPSETLRPAAPELRAELRGEAFWREHATRFLACAAHLTNDDADAAAAAVLAATASILSGERACPRGWSPVRFVLTVIHEVVAQGDFHNSR